MEQTRPTRRTYVLLGLALIAVICAAFGAVATIRHQRHTAPAPTRKITPAAPASWTPSTPALPGDVTTAWAYLDSTEGDMILGGDARQHPLDDLVIPGIAADYLNTLHQAGHSMSPHDTVTIEAALAGNDDAGQQLLDQAGDVDPTFARIIDVCQLTNTTTGPPRATVLDVARYGACLREGAIVDPDTSAWLLDQMRQTAGGIGDVRGNDGGQRLAQFNATTDAGQGQSRTVCMGVGAYWSAAVTVNWPTDRGQLYGVAACAQVARDQFPPDTQKAPDSPAPSESLVPNSDPASASPATTCPYGTCRATD